MGVTIEDIKRLRTMTGAGLSACKDALAQADSDFDKAMEIIREKVKLSQQNVAIICHRRLRIGWH